MSCFGYILLDDFYNDLEWRELHESES